MKVGDLFIDEREIVESFALSVAGDEPSSRV
jgi:hypothetical protein